MATAFFSSLAFSSYKSALYVQKMAQSGVSIDLAHSEYGIAQILFHPALTIGGAFSGIRFGEWDSGQWIVAGLLTPFLWYLLGLWLDWMVGVDGGGFRSRAVVMLSWIGLSACVLMIIAYLAYSWGQAGVLSSRDARIRLGWYAIGVLVLGTIATNRRPSLR